MKLELTVEKILKWLGTTVNLAIGIAAGILLADVAMDWLGLGGNCLCGGSTTVGSGG